jgi:uncharacterized membrane-anchored protein
VSFNNIVSPKVEIFYWVTILFSKTLGTGLGDFFAADSGLGYEGAAVVFAGAPALLAFSYFYTKISRAEMRSGFTPPSRYSSDPALFTNIRAAFISSF